MATAATNVIKRIQPTASKMDRFLKQSGLPAHFFCHDTTFANGMVAMLSNNAKFTAHYHATPTSLIYTDNKGRTLPDGAYLSHFLIDGVKDYSAKMAVMKKQFSWHHTLSIAANKADHQNLYTFFFSCSEADFLQHVLNYYYLYQQFINRYHKYFSDDIDRERESYQIDFQISNISLYQNNSLSLFENKNTNKIINLPGVRQEIFDLLSPQQIKCFDLVKY